MYQGRLFNISKILVVVLFLFLTIFLYFKTISLATSNTPRIHSIFIDKEDNYILDFPYSIENIDINNLISIEALDKNNQKVYYKPFIYVFDKQLVFNFNNWVDVIDKVVVNILVDINSTKYMPLNSNALEFLYNPYDQTLDANFFIYNGLAGLEWVKEEGVDYEIYYLNEKIVDRTNPLEKAIFLDKTTNNSMLLTDKEQLNKNLNYSYIVVAKRQNEIVSISKQLFTTQLVNRVPITIIDSIPFEIEREEDFVNTIAVEMFGGVIIDVPIYYEKIDNHTFTYSVINTPFQKMELQVNESILQQLEEEYVYRQMTYPKYFEEVQYVLVEESLILLEVIEGDTISITLNPYLTNQIMDASTYLKTMIQSGNSVINLAQYPILLDKEILQIHLNELAKKEGLFYSISYFGLDKQLKQLFVVFNDQVENQEVISERFFNIVSQLDGSLENIYEFLVTDYLFANQSNELTAYAFQLIATYFNYDVEVVKGTEHGLTTYWNKVILEDDIYYIDISKNIMATGNQTSSIYISEHELNKYGMQPY